MNRKSYLRVAYPICQSQIVLNSYTFHKTQIQVFVHTQRKHHIIITLVHYIVHLKVRCFATSPHWEYHLFNTQLASLQCRNSFHTLPQNTEVQDSALFYLTGL